MLKKIFLKPDYVTLMFSVLFSCLYIIADRYSDTERAYEVFFASQKELVFTLMKAAVLAIGFYFILKLLFAFLDKNSFKSATAELMTESLFAQAAVSCDISSNDIDSRDFDSHKAGENVKACTLTHRLKAFIYGRLRLVSFLVIFLCWLPWTVFNYPASFSIDAFGQIMQTRFIGVAALVDHHPVFSTFIMGVLLRAGNALGSINFGAYLYILLNAVFGAFVFSFGVKKLFEYGLRMRFCMGITCFFALLPLWGAFVQWYEKDLLYTEVITLFLILMIDCAVKKDCDLKVCLLLILTGILSTLLLQKGIYVVLTSVIALAFFMRGKARKYALIAFFSVSLLHASVTGVLYQIVLKIPDGQILEALSIPFQQTARYVKFYGDEVTDEEKKAIDGVLIYDDLSAVYSPYISDPVKRTYKQDNSMLGAYFSAWFKMFFKHPGVYFAATLSGSYGYLAPVVTNIDANIWDLDSYGDYFTPLKDYGIKDAFDGRFKADFTFLKNLNLTLPVLNITAMPGFYTWCVLICALILIKKKLYGSLVILLPPVMNILVCCASPVAYLMRYTLPTAAAAPFVIAWSVLLASCSNHVPAHKDAAWCTKNAARHILSFLLILALLLFTFAFISKVPDLVALTLRFIHSL